MMGDVLAALIASAPQARGAVHAVLRGALPYGPPRPLRGIAMTAQGAQAVHGVRAFE